MYRSKLKSNTKVMKPKPELKGVKLSQQSPIIPARPEINPNPSLPEQVPLKSPEVFPQRTNPEVEPKQPNREIDPESSPQVLPQSIPPEFPDTD